MKLSIIVKAIVLCAAVMAVSAFSGCGSIQPKSPAQTVYVIESEYNVALQVAVDYKNLPSCGTGATLCSDPAIVLKLQNADKTAASALADAESIVRSANPTADKLQNALNIAQQALNVLLAFEANLKTK
jgi:hypothetical protein